MVCILVRTICLSIKHVALLERIKSLVVQQILLRMSNVFILLEQTTLVAVLSVLLLLRKKLSPILGLNGYRRIIEQMNTYRINLPVIAIGGILLPDVSDIMQTGVSGIAVSGAILKLLTMIIVRLQQ